MRSTSLPRSLSFLSAGFSKSGSALASRATLAVLLAVGIAARCRQYLGRPSYWYDDAYLLLNIFEKSFTELVGPLQSSVVAPPLFLWILRGLYLLGGPSEWVMRLPGMAASVASLFLMLPLARRIVGSPGWLWAVAFCALSHHALILGSEVRPYSSDFLITEVILLASCAYFVPEVRGRHRARGLAGLFAPALLAPWVSFPSVFILGGVSLALLVEAIRGRLRTLWFSWLALTGLLSLSSMALWMTAARYLYYPGLQDHWAQRFVDVSSSGAAVAWMLRCVIGIANYGTTGMGVPLVLFGALGLAVLWKRSPALVVLLASPFALAGVAAALRRYPLGDRLVFFIVPCLWLAAATGIGSVVRRLRGRFAWAGAAILATLLLPDAIRMTKSLVVGDPRVEFREAFAYVHRHLSAGDRLWVSHPEVYEVYFGRTTGVLGAYTPLDVVEWAARRGPLWMIYTPQGPGMTNFAEVFERLQAVHSIPSRRHRVKGLDIVLYVPPDQQGRR